MKRTLKIKLTCVALALLSSAAFAKDYLETQLSNNSTGRNGDNIQGYLGGLSNQVNQDVGNVPGNRFAGDLYFDYHKDNSTSYTRDLDRRFTFATRVNDQSLTMFSLQEAYVAGQLTGKDHLKFGRQILDWSTVDEVWGFGKLNNRRNFDYFEPGQEGLIGLQYERRSANNMRYRAFVSGLFVPELNPALDIDKKDKTVTSRHPWGEAPATTVEVEPGNWKRIAYNVDYPEPQEVIYRYSVGASLGHESKHWVWNNFVMRKPENQMSTKVTVSLDPTADVVEANVTPQFFYHDVYGSTLKYRNRDIEMYVSGIAVRPNTFPDGDRDATRATDIKTEKIREDYVGGGISRVNDLYGVGVNYVARMSPYDRSKESLSLDPRWNQAVNVFLSRNFGRKFILTGDLKYDMLTTDRLTMMRAIYNVSKEIQMSLGVNMIGTPSDGKSYWSPYTNNDSVFGSLRYVF